MGHAHQRRDPTAQRLARVHKRPRGCAATGPGGLAGFFGGLVEGGAGRGQTHEREMGTPKNRTRIGINGGFRGRPPKDIEGRRELCSHPLKWEMEGTGGKDSASSFCNDILTKAWIAISTLRF